MRGLNVKLMGTWDFIVSALLDPFNNPNTGYIALNKSALNYGAPSEPIKSDNNNGLLSYFWSFAAASDEASKKDYQVSVNAASDNESTWSKLALTARYYFDDTIELSASKVLALKTLVQQTEADMKEPLRIQKIFLSISEDSKKSEFGSDSNLKDKINEDAVKDSKEMLKDIKDKELEHLLNRIRLLRRYGVDAESKILTTIEGINAVRQAQHKSSRSPAKADAYLRIWDNMLAWVEQNVTCLHICLAFEAPITTGSSIGGLWDMRDALEAKFVTYLFRTMCHVQLDKLNHGETEYTGYIRQLGEGEAITLLEKSQETIKALNNNVLVYPGLPRINKLITLIESVQVTALNAFNNIESRSFASVLRAIAPAFIAPGPNPFLSKMQDDLRGFRTEARELKNMIDLYLNSKETQAARQRLSAT